MRKILTLLAFTFLLTVLCQNHVSGQAGQLDTTFMAGSGSNGIAQQLELLSGDRIFVGGDFSSFSGSACKRVVRLLSSGQRDNSYLANTSTNGADGPVRSSGIQSDGKVVVGGLFNTVSGIARKNICRFDTSGAVDTSFAIGTGFNNEVTSLAVGGNRIFAAGFFSAYQGTTVPSFACLTLSGALDNTFALPTSSIFINSMAVAPNGQLYIAGSFTSYNGTAVSRVARINTNGSLDTTFNPGTGPNSVVSVIRLQPDGKLLIGGGFTSFNGTSINRIARLNTNGSLDMSFNPGTGANSSVRAINLQQNGKVLIAGDFSQVNSVSVPRIARLLANGTRDTTFNPGNGTNGTVYNILVQGDGKIVISGSFNLYHTTSVGNIVRIKGDPCMMPDSPTVTAGVSTVKCPGPGTTLQASGSLNDPAAKWYWYTGGCGATLIDSGSAITVSPTISTTYYVQGVSACGAGPCSAITINVSDTASPVPSQNSLPVMRSACSVTLTSPTAFDSCQGLIYATTLSPTTYTAEGTYNVTWSYNDNNGNISTQVQQVIISDSIAPVPDSVSLSPIISYCELTISSFPKATDNCVGKISATTTDSLHYKDTGTYVIHWTYNDGRGNTATQNQQVIVRSDTMKPVPDVKNLPALRGACSVTVSTFPKATDNCSGKITGTTNDSLTYSQQGNYTITWTYTDAKGNTVSQTQQVIVRDSIAPVPNVTTLAPVKGTCSAIITSLPNATDNCKGLITATTTDSLHYDTPGTYLVHWTYSDGNGNTVNQNQQVIVQDTLAPVPDSLSLPTVRGSCSATITVIPTATDQCKGKINGTTTSPLSYHQPGQYLLSWSYNDGRGNIRTQIQNVIVYDTLPPVPSVSTLPPVIARCGVTVTPPTAADQCRGTITATTSDPLTYSERGLYTLHWTYNDSNGNTSTQTQPVVISGLDTSISLNTTTAQLTANYNSSTATYQWFECMPSITPISSATSRIFTATHSGNYGVIVTDSGCADTSRCHGMTVTGTGVRESNAAAQFRVYPVPTSGMLNVSNLASVKDAVLYLYDLNGRLVREATLPSAGTFAIDISERDAGVYICEIRAGASVSRTKVVKQ